MPLGILALLLFALGASQTVTNSGAIAKPAWQLAIDQHEQTLAKKNGSGTNPRLRDELQALMLKDQDHRAFIVSKDNPNQVSILGGARREKFNLGGPDARDLELTLQLKKIVAENGWPTIRMVGSSASDAAMLMLVHSPDHAWQRLLIPHLMGLAARDDIDSASLALVIDKELISEGKPQRYGTQFKTSAGYAYLFAVEDPAHLDSRRASVFLPPLTFYKELYGRLHGIQMSDETVRPEAQN